MTAVHPSDAAEAHALTHSRQAEGATIAEINASYCRFREAGHNAGQILIIQINEARSIGIHLAGLKRTMRGSFSKLFTTTDGKPNLNPALGFSHQYGCNFMRFAARLPEPITTLPEAVNSLRDMMVMVGALPDPSREPQRSRGSLNWFTSARKIGMNFLAIFGKQREKADLREWQAVEINETVSLMKPAHELYLEARAEQERRER